MAKKLELQKVDTLAHAKNVIMTTILSKPTETLDFKTKEDVAAFLQKKFSRSLELGDFSYDPQGELIISIVMDCNLFKVLDDAVTIGEHVRAFFTEQGWEACSIVPGRLGIHQTMIRLKHQTIASMELMQQNTRTDRAIDSFLKKK